MSFREKSLDLVVLVADKNMEFAIKGALNRPQALRIRSVQFEFRTHSGRDGGVRTSGSSLLKLEKRRFRHALMVLDYEGCGVDGRSPLELEQELDNELHCEWGNNAKALVIDPELDIWMWGSDHALQEVFSWTHPILIREWLLQHQFELSATGKPQRPKEALAAVLKECGLPRSSANYMRVASRISLARCTEPSFLRMRKELQAWFPADFQTENA
jgi:hypothetical protein